MCSIINLQQNGFYSQIVYEIIEQLLILGISDSDSQIRLTVIIKNIIFLKN